MLHIAEIWQTQVVTVQQAMSLHFSTLSLIGAISWQTQKKKKIKESVMFLYISTYIADSDKLSDYYLLLCVRVAISFLSIVVVFLI